MGSDELYRPLYVTDLLVNALNQDPDRPLLQLLGGPMLTVGEVRDATSCYVQALASLGVGRETRIALLSANRPEVLHVSHAVQILAGITAPLHPLGSAADHLYQIQDGGIEILVFEGERYSARAAELARGAPGLRLASIGPSPIADDLGTLAAGLSPQHRHYYRHHHHYRHHYRAHARVDINLPAHPRVPPPPPPPPRP